MVKSDPIDRNRLVNMLVDSILKHKKRKKKSMTFLHCICLNNQSNKPQI